ncbi:nucleotide disphospho-sugar-binding domain-containing protein [Nocardia sp. NPDC020380]|uniref:nucleotide disphospho-sugar-binding domain-containing protein n=1 Tax=Nocardia sp. NPDC020380 TaxID=3364309 RepID=UPI0037ABEAE3
MRVLLAASVAHSHLTAMIPLGWALRAAGHDVLVACQPGQRDCALGSALPAVTIGSDLDFAEWHRQRRATGGQREYRSEDTLAVMFHTVTEMMVPDLVALAEEWRPQLVVRDPITFAAEIAAAAIGVPALRQLWGPDLFGTHEGLWLLSLLRERLDPLFTGYGATPPELLSQWSIDPCPDGLQKYGEGTPIAIRYVAADIGGAIPEWLTTPPARPRICITWGTFSAGLPGSYLVPEVVQALRELEVEPVIATTAADRALLGDLPADVRIAESVPLHLLLPSCAAIIHHGGGNTMLGAAIAGVPQLIISHMFERKLHGERLAATGAGRHLPAAEATTANILAATAALLNDPAHHAGAAALRSESLARPEPAAVVGRLESLTGAA